MIKDQIVKEQNLKHQCSYCGQILDKRFWQSHFESDIHYKKFLCKCGKEVNIKVDFSGSGHDSWDGTDLWKEDIKKENKKGTKVRTLESHIQIIEKKNKK